MYVDIGFDLRSLPRDLVPFLSLYCEYITRCGAAGFPYESMAKRIALSTGGLHASVTGKTLIGTEDGHFFHLFIHAKSLVPRFAETCRILRDIMVEPDIRHEKLVRDIILEERNSLHHAVIGSGHHFALTHAASQLLDARKIDEQVRGITQLRFLETLVRTDDPASVLASLRRVHTFVINRDTSFISVTADEPESATEELSALISSLPGTTVVPPAAPPAPPVHVNGPAGIEISSAVNFVGQVWKTGPVQPASAGHLLLMGRILSAGFLWDKIRVEGGAYGGMSLSSVTHPLFSCASYRDPNLASTVKHFKKGLELIADGLPQEVVTQNIIGTIGRIDAPMTPHDRGFGESVALLVGNDEPFRQQLREAVFNATSEELARLAQRFLDSENHAITVLGSAAAFEQAQKEGFTCEREPLLPGENGR
jgi:Zn-dependent M16 (insulinase) family peptidase